MNLEDLYRLLRTEHVQAQGMIDTIDDPLLVIDQALCVQSASRAFYQTFKVGRDETIGRPIYELGNGQWNIPELRLLLQEVAPKAHAITDYELSHDFPSIGQRIMLLSARRLYHPDNNSPNLLVVIEDVTERRRISHAKDLVIGEIQHRLKNLLAVVQAMARMTEVEGHSAREYRDAFLGRLDALIKTYDLSMPGQVRPDLHELASRVSTMLGSEAVIIEAGLSAALAPEQVLPLGMILHELGTNAIKHGALSAPRGRVRLGWTLNDETGDQRLVLHWQEEGGPVVQEPASQGFGTRLINGAARDLHGRVELTFARSGLQAEVNIPMR
jgi:two-component sensor histidine kinase